MPSCNYTGTTFTCKLTNLKTLHFGVHFILALQVRVVKKGKNFTQVNTLAK